MTLVYVEFTVVALLSALSGGALSWLIFRSREAALTERLRGRDAEISRLTEELTKLRTEAIKLSTLTTQLGTQLDAERQAHERLTNEFKALSADALRANRLDFLEHAKQAFGLLQQQSAGDLEQRKLAVEALVRPIRESLEKVDSKIGEMEKARAGAYGALAEQLRALQTSQLQLQTEAAKLSSALRSTSYAGSWGELQLRRIVEMADMLPYCDFCEQQTSGSLRADLVVRLPGGQQIVVDAKTPLESYRATADVGDESQRAQRMLEHAGNVRAHIDALSAKSYWQQFQPTPEFVVLFLPGEHFLSAALQADKLLLDRAVSRKVLLATPTTLIALLKAAAYGWSSHSLSKNAEEICSAGRILYDRIVVFSDFLQKIGRGLDLAVDSYNKAVGSYEHMLLPGGKKLAELGARGSKQLPEPKAIVTQTRDVVHKA